MSTRYYCTTPIYYVNGAPHIGHAYTCVATDVLARWKRLEGREVFFLTGTDEHGQKVEKAAADAGVDPQTFIDGMAEGFRAMAAKMNTSNDMFIRTTEPRHKAAVAALWQKLEERGEIYLGSYEGWYAVRDEAFYGEDELTVKPDGKRYAPTGAPVERVTEPSYFFRLSQWGGKLLQFYDDNPDFIAPQARRNEVISFVKQGLTDLSISRTSFSWGVPVPGDSKHVVYVWLDALTNYLTAVGYPDEAAPSWPFWPADLHMVGKDILRFHAIFWPAFLMAAGLPLPRRVFAHGWWTVEGEKMSKSLGNTIEPGALVDEFGLDPVRFFLLREVPFGNDGDFSRRAMIGRMNNELANDLGNLAQRTLSLIARNCDGLLPARGAGTEEDAVLLGDAAALPEKMGAQINRQAFHEALEEAWKVIRAANGYIDRQAPWALKKTDPQRMRDVLRVLADTLRIVAMVLQPFMPDSAARMLVQLGMKEAAQTPVSFGDLDAAVPEGTELPAPQGIFPRFTEVI